MSLYCYHGVSLACSDHPVIINLSNVEMIRRWDIKGKPFMRLDFSSLKCYITVEDYEAMIAPRVLLKEPKGKL